MRINIDDADIGDGLAYRYSGKLFTGEMVETDQDGQCSKSPDPGRRTGEWTRAILVNPSGIIRRRKDVNGELQRWFTEHDATVEVRT